MATLSNTRNANINAFWNESKSHDRHGSEVMPLTGNELSKFYLSEPIFKAFFTWGCIE